MWLDKKRKSKTIPIAAKIGFKT